MLRHYKTPLCPVGLAVTRVHAGKVREIMPTLAVAEKNDEEKSSGVIGHYKWN